ncbi:MAG: thiamine pyrophosphate-binding protein [Rhodospirillales bacterium]|nr:thiamine pyrophosphate-binding protein [Rhodospirillales bacterium]
MNSPRTDLNSDPHNVAAWVAQCLQRRGVGRVFGLQGGHIQPIWDRIAQLGIPIVDVRDEGAAVHMAHAHAELTGELGVCMATAGPGVTNCVTGMANADLARVPVLLIGGCTTRAQANMGPLQDVPHVALLAPVTRYARTARVPEHVIRELDLAISCATGDGGEPGPAYLEIPTDVLRESVPPTLVLDEWLAPKPPRKIAPDPGAIAEAAAAIREARRPLAISGRGARGADDELSSFLDVTGALYLDTQESRGLVPPDHPSIVGAVRSAAMSQADLVITLGRKLDYQLAYGSPGVFPDARFMRIADTASDLNDNRRGAPEVLASVGPALAALAEELRDDAGGLDTAWADGLRAKHRERTERGRNDPGPQAGEDGKIHPMAIFRAIGEISAPDCIGIADGGDFLSFARIGLQTTTYLDAGTFGCLGVGVPFAIAAALAFPRRQVICVTGDGAFGINAMEIDTAVRHAAQAVFIISNNAGWNIERYDQEVNYAGRIVGTELAHSDYAAMARALGAHGERVEDPSELADAIRRGLENAPAVIDVVTSRDVSSDATKGLSVVPDYQPLSAWDDAERRRRGSA